MASLFRRKKRDGSYYEEWQAAICLPDGKRVTKSLKTSSKREALKRAARIEAEILERQLDGKLKGESMTVSQLLDMYVEHHSKPNKASWKNDVYCSNNLNPRLGNLKLTKLTPLHLASYVKIRRSEEDVTNTTIHHDLRVLRHAFNKALMEWGLVRETPFARFKLPKENPARERFLSSEEIVKMMKELPEPMKPVVIMALNTGLRLSNIIFMQWKWIDFENGIITIPAESHKNRKTHKVAMNETVFSLLKEIRKNRGKVVNLESANFVFLHDQGKPYSKNTAGRAFARAAKRAKLDVTFHDLRRTFSTIAGSKGASAFDLRDALGHCDVRMTSKYTRTVFDRMREVVNLVEVKL